MNSAHPPHVLGYRAQQRDGMAGLCWFERSRAASGSLGLYAEEYPAARGEVHDAAPTRS
jgi:hypothetical protein